MDHASHSFRIFFAFWACSWIGRSIARIPMVQDSSTAGLQGLVAQPIWNSSRCCSFRFRQTDAMWYGFMSIKVMLGGGFPPRQGQGSRTEPRRQAQRRDFNKLQYATKLLQENANRKAEPYDTEHEARNSFTNHQSYQIILNNTLMPILGAMPASLGEYNSLASLFP